MQLRSNFLFTRSYRCVSNSKRSIWRSARQFSTGDNWNSWEYGTFPLSKPYKTLSNQEINLEGVPIAAQSKGRVSNRVRVRNTATSVAPDCVTQSVVVPLWKQISEAEVEKQIRRLEPLL